MVECFVLLLVIDTILTGFMVGAYKHTTKAFTALQEAYAAAFQAMRETGTAGAPVASMED